MREGEWCVSVANPEYAKKILLRLGESSISCNIYSPVTFTLGWLRIMMSWSTFTDVFPKRLFPFECKETLVVRLFGTSSIAQRNGDQWKRHHKVTNRGKCTRMIN